MSRLNLVEHLLRYNGRAVSKSDRLAVDELLEVCFRVASEFSCLLCEEFGVGSDRDTEVTLAGFSI